MTRGIVISLLVFLLAPVVYPATVGVVAYIHCPEGTPAGRRIWVNGNQGWVGQFIGSIVTNSGGAETLVSTHSSWAFGDSMTLYAVDVAGNLLSDHTVRLSDVCTLVNNYEGASESMPLSLPQYFEGGYGVDGSISVEVHFHIQPVGGTNDYPVTPSEDVEEGSTREPIDTKNGNTYFTEKRISLPCPGIPLDLDLKYQSAAGLPVGALGTGWRHSFEWALEPKSDQAVRCTGDGRKWVFMTDGEGGYLPPAGKNWTLKEIPSGFEVEMPGGLVYSFDTHGALSAVQDAWGIGLACSRGTNGLLESVTHSNGRRIVFSNRWHEACGEWRVARIAVQDGMSLAFGYNGDGQFTQVVECAGGDINTSHYRYADSFLTNKVNGAGFEYTFGYETGADGRLAGKGTHLDAGGFYAHEVEYTAPETTRVSYSLRGREQVFLYERGDDEMLALRYGPGEAVEAAMTRGVEYTYGENHEDMIRRTLFDSSIDESWSEWMFYDDSHNLTNYALSCGTNHPVSRFSVRYDPRWRLPAVLTDAEGFRIETIYTNGAPLVVRAFHSAADSSRTCFGYTDGGQVKTMTNANSHVVDFGYDEDGNLNHMAAELGPVVSNTFSRLGFIRSTEILSESGGATGRIRKYDTDARGRIRRITHYDGLTEHFAYNALGYLTNSVDRAGRITDYTYAPGRALTSVTEYLNRGGSNIPVQVAYERDEQLNLLRITDPCGRRAESRRFDIQDRITAVTNMEGQVMDIAYGVGSFVRRIRRFDGSVMSNAYDAVGRRISTAYLSSANQGIAEVSHSYYPDGKLKASGDGASSLAFSYDGLNRLAAVTSSVSSAMPADYTVVLSRDTVGHMTNSAVMMGEAVLLTAGRSYDAAERLAEIRSDNGLMAESFVYAYNSENGRIQSVSNTLTGITCTYAYDLLNRVTNILYNSTAGSVIGVIGYDYNAVGMITRKVVDGDAVEPLSVSFGYDSLDRLVHETIFGNSSLPRSSQYTYDLAGNRLSKVTDGIHTGYASGAGNRLLSITTEALTNTLYITGSSSERIGTDNRWGALWVSNLTAGASTVPSVNGRDFFAALPAVAGMSNSVHAAIRDPAGNMGYAGKDFWVDGTASDAEHATRHFGYNTAGCMTNGSDCFLEWDERYRLIAVTSGSAVVNYSYDVLGRRVSRTMTSPQNPGNTNRTCFVFDGNRIVADLDAAGRLLRTYVWGRGIDNLLCFTDHISGSTYYAVTDHQCSILALADASGALVERYEYDAFGSTRVFDAGGNQLKASAVGNRYGFHGREIDWDTGFYCFRARWYDPAIGRWLSRDPVGISGGLNLYAAFDNNPVVFADPGGLDVAYLLDSAALARAGHGAAAVGDENNGWTYYSFGPGRNMFDTSDNLDVKHYRVFADLLDANRRYDGYVRYRTTPSADRAAHAEALSNIGKRYNLFGQNCDDIAADILRAAGISMHDHWRPVDTFNNLPRPDECVE
jgi:RHS repeat-associated protein